MDLTIKLNTHTLNIRVVVILETEKGYLLEQNKKVGFYFFTGGRIKVGESSLQAAIRETLEETGLKIDKFEFVSVIENFFESQGLNNEGKFQEICFVYKTDKIKNVDPEFGLKEFTKEEMKNMDIRPEIIKELIVTDKLNTITHFIV